MRCHYLFVIMCLYLLGFAFMTVVILVFFFINFSLLQVRKVGFLRCCLPPLFLVILVLCLLAGIGFLVYRYQSYREHTLTLTVDNILGPDRLVGPKPLDSIVRLLSIIDYQWTNSYLFLIHLKIENLKGLVR